MSKITNDMAYPGLAQDALQLYPYGNGGRQRVLRALASYCSQPVWWTIVWGRVLHTGTSQTRRPTVADSRHIARSVDIINAATNITQWRRQAHGDEQNDNHIQPL